MNEKSIKALRTLLGGLTLLVGVVAIPYPGPGWLIVFAGLAILARDYPTAQRILDTVKQRYEQWQKWMKRQTIWVRLTLWTSTLLIVVATIYLLNGYGLINLWFNLNQDWLMSPLVR